MLSEIFILALLKFNETKQTKKYCRRGFYNWRTNYLRKKLKRYKICKRCSFELRMKEKTSNLIAEFVIHKSDQFGHQQSFSYENISESRFVEN